ncbi:MAG: hypothetical protein U9N84_03815, partial [Actinomycetota bacterium]|nr:hypothetical protein [Actinomycetota bacterium]
MRAELIASAYGRSGRHLKYITIISALVLIDAWLWLRAAFGLTPVTTLVRVEMAIAIGAAIAAALAIYSLWRNPLSDNLRTMATPSLRQSLATHHAGHVLAAYLQDPSGVAKTGLSGPCLTRAKGVPVITETALRAELTLALAGMTAEEIFAGESGSHTAADLAHATAIGADMVGRFGMGGSLVSLAASHTKRSGFIDMVLADARTRKELEALLRDAKRETMRMMLEHRYVIVELRDALLRHHRLRATEIRRLIDNAETVRHADDAVLVDLRSASDRVRPL